MLGEKEEGSKTLSFEPFPEKANFPYEKVRLMNGRPISKGRVHEGRYIQLLAPAGFLASARVRAGADSGAAEGRYLESGFRGWGIWGIWGKDF